MSAFDIGAAMLLLCSCVVGLVRGATREVVTVTALVLAAIISVVALRVTGPVARHFVHAIWLARTLAIFAGFLVAYILLRLIGGALTRTVQQTPLSGLDRGLGLGIGLVRALVVLGGFVLLLEAATPPERMPRWISGAHLYPVAQASGDALRAFAPKGMQMVREVAPALRSAVAADDVAGTGVDTPTAIRSGVGEQVGRRRGEEGIAEDLR